MGGCAIEWFHISCVSIAKLTNKIKKGYLFLKIIKNIIFLYLYLQGKWYCPDHRETNP